MSWYYAENSERRGPVDDATFQGLVANGTIRPDTLVWQEGMPDWKPYGQIAGAPAPGGPPPPPFVPAGSGGATVCSQCGRTFAPDELVTLGGRLVCAGCKPLAVQQMMEGTGVGSSLAMGGAIVDPERFVAELRARGGYNIDVGSIISRAWKVVMADFWPYLGVTLLVYLVLGVAGVIPCIGNLSPFLVQGPLMGGLFLYYLKKIRGQPAEVGDAFSGFTKQFWGKLALAGTVQVVPLIVLIIPAVFVNMRHMQEHNSEPPMGMFIWILLAMPLIIWLSVSWFFSFALIIDKGLEFWPAMELSRKVVNMRFWSWILLFLVNALLSMAGFLCLCVGIFVALPVTFCAMMVAYEDVFSSGQSPNS